MYKIFEKLAKVRGVSTYFVAKETGIAINTFYSWRDGKYHPKDEKLEKVAEFFDVPLAYLKGQQKTIQCPECHLDYNPVVAASIQKHKAYHKRFLDTEKRYCVTIPSREDAENKRADALKVLRDIKYDKFQRIAAFNSFAKSDFILHLYFTEFDPSADLDAHMKLLAEKLRPDSAVSLNLCNAIREVFGIDPYEEEAAITEKEYELVLRYRLLSEESRGLIDRMLDVGGAI